jgi:hypothetical protein
MARSGQFGKDFDSFTLDFAEASEETVRVVTAQTWGAIIEGWPVDEGRSRANWFATGQAPSEAITEAVDKSDNGTKTANKAEKKVFSIKRWDSFFLTNNMPYSPVIEYGGYPDPVKLGTRLKDGSYEKRSKSGYSKQAPNGSVRLNMNKSGRLMEAEARKRFKKL